MKANNPLYADIEINISNIPTFWINDINNNGDIDRNFEINENATESGQSDVDFSIEGKSSTEEHYLQEEEDSNPIDNFRVSTAETAYVPDLAYNVIDNSNIVIAPAEDREHVPIICDDDCEILAHPFFFPKGKFGYSHVRDIKLSPCKYFIVQWTIKGL